MHISSVRTVSATRPLKLFIKILLGRCQCQPWFPSVWNATVRIEIGHQHSLGILVDSSAVYKWLLILIVGLSRVDRRHFRSHMRCQHN